MIDTIQAANDTPRTFRTFVITANFGLAAWFACLWNAVMASSGFRGHFLLDDRLSDVGADPAKRPCRLSLSLHDLSN